MRLLAVLLTSNAALIDVVERSHSDLCVAIVRNARIGKAIQLDIVCFNPGRRSKTFVEFLGENIGVAENRPTHAIYDGVVVLHDRNAAQHMADIRDGIFAASLEQHDYIEKRDNFLVRSFGRVVKNLHILMSTMHDKTRMEAAILPAHNFDSAVFRRFLKLCQDEAAASEFQNLVVPALTAVTKTRGPRRRSTYPTKYFQDERLACFRYGDERHSSFETGGDHTIACTIRGLFRLGVPLEQQRHFNVMTAVENTLISGDFRNCHDQRIAVENRSHLNMFSNDFLK